MKAEMDQAVDEIVDLTRTFLAGRITAADFDSSYRDLFSRMPVLGDPTFSILQELAFACSDYVEDPAMRDEPGDLDEAGLTAAAQTALSALGLQ